VAVGAGLLAAGLELQDDIAELLPAGTKSVEDLRRISQKVGGGNLTIAIQSPDLRTNERFAEDLVARLRARMSPDIRYIDYTVRALVDFYERNAILYADLADLERIERDLKAEIDDRKLKANPLYVDLDGDAPSPVSSQPAGPPARDRFDEIQERIDRARRDYDPYPDSYFANETGTLLAVFVRPSPQGMALGAKAFTARIRALIDELSPHRYRPDLRVDLTGEVQTGLEEYESVKRDIASTAGLCVGLVALAVLLYFRRLRVLGLLGLTLAVGALLSFALARVLFGRINFETAFLGSIIVGTGINYGIIFLSRYLEERQEGQEAEAAVLTALQTTWRATFVAALATAISFGALFFGRITAFHQFGVVGGAGIFFCWLLTFTLLPALTLLLERVRPSVGERRRFREWQYPRWLAAIPIRWPEAVVVASVVVGAVSVWKVHAFLPDCLETNLANLRNKALDGTYTAELDDRVAHIYRRSMTPVFMVARTADQARRICEVFNGLVQQMGEAHAPIRRCHSIYERMPVQVGQKLAIASRLRRLVDQVPEDEIPAHARELVGKLRARLYARPFEIADLPEPVRRFYQSSDGALGTVVHIEPPGGRDLWVARNLFEFTDAVRSVTVDGETITTSGMVVVFADILRTIARDGPLTTVIAAAGVLLVVLLGLGSVRGAAVVGVALVVGVVWMMGAAAGAQIKINFMNFVALPTTFGIAVDYAANIWQRARGEPKSAQGLARTLERTGGAVFLCSLTTIIGYFALVMAKNMALASMGKLAMLGEFTCLAAAMLLLPALLRLATGARQRP